MVMGSLTGRMGLSPILPVKLSVTIGTMINLWRWRWRGRNVYALFTRNVCVCVCVKFCIESMVTQTLTQNGSETHSLGFPLTHFGSFHADADANATCKQSLNRPYNHLLCCRRRRSRWRSVKRSTSLTKSSWRHLAATSTKENKIYFYRKRSVPNCATALHQVS